MTQNFLIRWGDQFLLSWDGKSQPEWTSIPSRAAHLEYQDADLNAQDLQDAGWDCEVTNLWGEPATLEVIREEENRDTGEPGIVPVTI